MTQIKFNVPERLIAQSLGIPHGTLKARRNRGDLPAYCYLKYSYKVVMYSRAILNDWILDPTDTESADIAIEHHKISCLNIRGNLHSENDITFNAMTEFRFDTSETNAAKAIGISRWSLRDRRYSGEVPSYTYIRFGTKLIRYCVPLLADWAIDPSDLDAQLRAQSVFKNSRVSSPSNLPKAS